MCLSRKIWSSDPRPFFLDVVADIAGYKVASRITPIRPTNRSQSSSQSGSKLLTAQPLPGLTSLAKMVGQDSSGIQSLPFWSRCVANVRGNIFYEGISSFRRPEKPGDSSPFQTNNLLLLQRSVQPSLRALRSFRFWFASHRFCLRHCSSEPSFSHVFSRSLVRSRSSSSGFGSLGSPALQSRIFRLRGFNLQHPHSAVQAFGSSGIAVQDLQQIGFSPQLCRPFVQAEPPSNPFFTRISIPCFNLK
jgi:hypothetical protein